jgi:hypothetical protein
MATRNINFTEAIKMTESASSERVVKVIPQNVEFNTKFDTGIFTGLLTRPTKTVIVRQDPAPGDFVPAGTPIKITVVEKGIIPIKSFNGLTANLADKFTNIAQLEDDLGNPGDPVSKNAKTVLDKGLPYEQLADADKAALTSYVQTKLGGNVADVAKAANDVMFLYGL